MKESKMQYINRRFDELGIKYEDLADEVMQEQLSHNPWLDNEIALKAVRSVIRKREIQHALVFALSVDELTEKKLFPSPIQEILEEDNSQFGIDESIAMVSSLLFGTISATNYGHLDVDKVESAKKLNDMQKRGEHITTMTDDMISAIVASAEGKVSQNVHMKKG